MKLGTVVICHLVSESVQVTVTKIPQTGLQQQTFISHVWEARRPMSRCRQVRWLARAHLPVCRQLSSHCILSWWRESTVVSLPPNKGTDPIPEGSPSRPSHHGPPCWRPRAVWILPLLGSALSPAPAYTGSDPSDPDPAWVKAHYPQKV